MKRKDLHLFKHLESHYYYFQKKQTRSAARIFITLFMDNSPAMIALLDAIHNGDEPRLVLVSKETMRVGHSSGMDSVTGLLIGLCVWNKENFT